MKAILISVLLVTASMAIKLEVGAQVDLSRPLSLACSGAQGSVSYEAQNLPQGVRLYNDKIELFDNNKAQTGFYPVKIKASDAAGSVDERIIVISIRADNSVAFNAGNIFNSQAGSTVSVTTSSSSSSSSSSSGNIRGGAQTVAPVTPAPLPQPDSGVGALLDSLQLPSNYAPGATAPSTTTATPSDSSYPTIKFPTGGNVNAPNFTPTEISNSRAPRSTANRNEITADDVKTKATFERQVNAAKALANLLSIVKQATANKNAAQEETVKRQALYDDAVKKQRDAQAVVTKAEGDVNRVRQAINLLNDNIAALKKKIADTEALDKDLRSQKDTVTQGAQNAQSQLKQTNNDLVANTRNINDAKDAKAAKEKECGDLDNALSNTRSDRDGKVVQLADLTYKLGNAKNQAAADAQKVKDLENQLAAAKDALAKSQGAVADLANQQNALNNAITDLNKRIDDLTARKNKCADELAAIADRIQKLYDNADALNQKKSKIESELKQLTDKITSLNEQINKIPGILADYNNQLNQLNKNLNYLINQLPIFQRILNDAYIAGNSANDAVKAAKQNLDAAVARFTREQKIESDATNNIELARIEKDQADQAVEALLRDGAGLLPYAAAAPADSYNNAVVAGDNGAYNIKSWSDFVSSGYGAGVKPLFVGDLKTLYSFKLPAADSAAANGNGNGNGDCAANNLKAFSGFIVGLAPGSLRVLGDGGNTYQVGYSSCTGALANKQGYSLAVGDVVVVRGQPTGANSFKAVNLACLSQ